MTVFYADDVSNGEGIQVVFRLLRRWRGSLYKLLWLDLLIYLAIYYGLNLSYRFLMTQEQRRIFEALVISCESALPGIPISFLLGFYVSGIVSRWFFVYTCIPWMNKISLLVAASINGKEEEIARKIRLSLMRYVNLSWILMMRLISDQVADRFPDLEESQTSGQAIWRRSRKPKLHRNLHQPWHIGQAHTPPRRLTNSMGNSTPMQPPSSNLPDSNTCPTPAIHFTFDGFQAVDDFELSHTLRAMNNDKMIKGTYGLIITEEEISSFQNIASNWYNRTKTKYTPEYWVPIQWAQRLTLKALQHGHIAEPRVAYSILSELLRFRDKLQYLQLFSSLIIPLAYSQVVTIAVHSYFLCKIFASQFIERMDSGDLYFPAVSVFSFLFLMGWFKVALCVINPFGDDDEDFQISDILNYNLEVSYRMVYMNPEAFPENLAHYFRTAEDATDLDVFLRKIDEDVENNTVSPRKRTLTVVKQSDVVVSYV